MTIESQIAELKRQIEVMEAYERGEAIEYRARGTHRADGYSRDAIRAERPWSLSPSARVGFDWDNFDYRVKPKKREVWLDKKLLNRLTTCYATEGLVMNAVVADSELHVRFVEAD